MYCRELYSYSESKTSFGMRFALFQFKNNSNFLALKILKLTTVEHESPYLCKATDQNRNKNCTK